MSAWGQSRRFDDVRDVSASPSAAAEPPNRYITANRRDRPRPEILCRLWGWWRLPTDGLPRLAGAGFNPSCKDDPGRFVGEGAGRDVNTFGPVFYLARTDTRFDSRIRRQYAPRVRGASRCCRPLPRSQPGESPAPPALYRGRGALSFRYAPGARFARAAALVITGQ